jgi:alpha-L-rhamnosidase
MNALVRMLIALLLCSAPLRRAACQSTPSGTMGIGDARWIADAAMARAADTMHWTFETGAPGVRGPFPLLRKTFALSATSPIRRAELVVTALGSYQVTLNGRRTSNAVLTPDWTDYRRRLPYQTYDVTSLIRSGTNAIGVQLGEGWYGSPVGTAPYGYGPPPVRVRCLLIVTHANGRVETIASDSSWRSAPGPIRMSQIYAGETYDARALPAGWNQSSFNDRAWTPVRVLDGPVGLAPDNPVQLEPQRSPLIQRTRLVVPVRRIVVAPDTIVYDLGQNMVGWMRFRVRGPAGSTVQLRHAEVLMPDGQHLQRSNLREAEATDQYTLAGRGAETYEPHFTYHGFRYVEVVASAGVRMDSLSGVVFHTAARETATFDTRNPKLARLWENIVWSLRGNLMSVPTDCPQRSERFAWLGDAAAFWPTAVYLMDLESFTGKWLQDLRDSQLDVRDANTQEGKDTTVVGCFPARTPPITSRCGGPGWSDAGILVPFAAYRQYGDTAQVRAHWVAMERYMAFIAANNPTFLWQTHSGGYGDWYPAASDEQTGGELIATAFWAADAMAMRDLAQGLGNQEAEARYATLYDHIRAAFARAYIGSDGSVGQLVSPSENASGTMPADTTRRRLTSQTSDVLALKYGLVPETLRSAVTGHLVSEIATRHGHLATGFLGTPRILPVLSEQGRDDIAYQLLLEEGLPSWLYMVNAGATTMWERWDGDLRPTTTSFNHYAYGAVGEWLLKYAVGITQDTSSTAFRHIVIHPHLDPLARLTHLGAQYRSHVGVIASTWTIDSITNVVTLVVRIPPGQEARVDVPLRRGTSFTYVSHIVGAGTHRFRTPARSVTADVQRATAARSRNEVFIY